MSKGPLAVSWGATPSLAPQAGVREIVRVELGNDGALIWGESINVAYHWLDDRDNPIVWDGDRTPAPRLGPGDTGVATVLVRGPIPPGRYRLAFDLVAERRAWFSELGSPMLAQDLDVLPRAGEPNATLPPNVERSADWSERVRAAHADGYAVVGGAIEWMDGRRPRALAAYAPGPGRVPGFSGALICPSVLPGVELERLDDVAGLPAYAAPRDEPWVYDGRAILRVRAA